MSHLPDVESLTIAQISKALAEAGVPLPANRALKIDLITLAKNNAKSPWCQSGKANRKSLGKDAPPPPSATSAKPRSKTPAKSALAAPPVPAAQSPQKAAPPSSPAPVAPASTPGEKKSKKSSTPAKASTPAAAAVSPSKPSPSNIIKKAAATPRGESSETKATATKHSAPETAPINSVHAAAAKSWSMLLFWALLFASILAFAGVNRFVPCMNDVPPANGVCSPLASFVPVNTLACNQGFFLLNGACVKCPSGASCDDWFSPVKCSNDSFYVSESNTCQPSVNKQCVASARAAVSFLRRQLGRHVQLDLSNVTVNGSVVSTQIHFSTAEVVAKASNVSSPDMVSCTEHHLNSFHAEVSKDAQGRWSARVPIHDIIGYAKEHYVITSAILFALLCSSN